MNIRVLLADDHNLVRAGLRALLDRVPGVTIVAEASDGLEALAAVESEGPDVVLADIGMPGLNGFNLTARIAARWPDVRVIIVSVHHTDAYITEALRAGASGYLLKDTSVAELELAITSVVSGGKYLSPTVSRQMVDAHVIQDASPTPATDTRGLTLRQREVLQLIAEGHGTKEVARKLSISAKTVATHRAEVMQRLNIHEVAGLVRYAIQAGIAQVG